VELLKYLVMLVELWLLLGACTLVWWASNKYLRLDFILLEVICSGLLFCAVLMSLPIVLVVWGVWRIGWPDQFASHRKAVARRRPFASPGTPGGSS
jgi:hypothetical protein